MTDQFVRTFTSVICVSINVFKSSGIVDVAMWLNLISFFFKPQQRVTVVLINPFKARPDVVVKKKL